MILQNSFLKKPFFPRKYLVEILNISSPQDNLSLSKFNKIFKYFPAKWEIAKFYF